jgi:type II secretion system protein I
VKRNNQGFTLIEVMVAVGIFAVTVSAIVLSTSQSISSAKQLKDKIQARDVAEQFITNIWISKDLPDDGVHHEEVEQGDRQWLVDLQVDTIPYFKEEPFNIIAKRIEVKTKPANEDQYSDVYIAIVSEPGP